MEGIVFSNVNELVKNQDAISEPIKDGCWGVLPYEIDEVTGNCLVTREDDHPADLILAPKLTGWYKIFIASWKIAGGYSFRLKLDNEKYFKFFNDSSYPSSGQWSRMEYAEESFWRCADLTDREIIVKKAPAYGGLSPLVWVRCVPMTEEEIAEYKDYINPEGHRNLHLHFDGDTNLFYGVKNVDDALLKLTSVENTDAKLVTIECLEKLYSHAPNSPAARRLNSQSNEYADGNADAAALFAEIARARVALMHEFGTKAYAGLRMSLGDASSPNKSGEVMKFTAAHPACHIYTRDGRRVPIASYAYKETQDYVIEYLKELVSYGFDGVSLLFQRGMHIAFEQPVLDEFARRYDGLDARRVPMDDPRLKDVWCSFITDFIRRLRKELDASAGRHVGINIITGYTPEISRRVGVDVEAMAKEGLIDYITGCCMETYENLSGCVGEDGLIDLDEYKRRLPKQYMVSRKYGGIWDLVKEGSLAYKAIADQYGIEYFAPIMAHRPWCAEDYHNWVDDLKALGMKNIAFFNFCHSSQDIPVYHTMTKVGHDKVNLEYCRLTPYRVMSLDGVDISTYMPHWNG